MTDENKTIDVPADTVTSDQESPSTMTPTDEKPSEKKEWGGPKGLEPTRYGDWEKAGRCIDF